MRIADGGGWDPVTGNTYQVKTMAVTPGPVSGMTAPQIEALFSYLDPSAVAEAGKAHAAAARTLQSVADSLVTHAQALAGSWNGTAAQGSIAAFRQLHQTAVQLAQASAQTGQVLTWLGETILPYYKNWKAPGNGIVGTIESLFGSNPQDQAAQQVMKRLNDRLGQANAGLPASVSIDLPKIGQAGHAPATTGSVGSGGGAGAAAAGVALTGGVRGTAGAVGSGGGITGVHPGGAGVSGRGPAVSGGLGVVPVGPGGPAASPTHLAGLPPGGGTVPGAGSLPGGPAGVPGGGGLPGGGLPGGGVPVGLPGGGAPGGLPGGGGAPGDGVAAEPEPIGPVPESGQAIVPGAGGEPGLGGEPPDAIGVPGGGASPGVAGAFPGEPGEPGVGGGVGSGLGDRGLVGEDVGFPPSQSAVMGSDGMIGTEPGIAEGESGPGGSRATGFVGADDAVAEPDGGLPATGGSGGGRRENERYRQAWMAEDADIWEGEAAPPPH
jgi:uncharacterized protein YukE